ncbi:DUF448 domain-containing protein [Helicobacter pametensis]|nr:DUF448 domain-containing protein [Helicobacter pametensis]
MCVVCRNRFVQKDLLRLSMRGDGLKVFDGYGRSFYLCPECLKNPKSEDRLAKIKKFDAQARHQMKEIIVLWESRSRNLLQS